MVVVLCNKSFLLLWIIFGLFAKTSELFYARDEIHLYLLGMGKLRVWLRYNFFPRPYKLINSIDHVNLGIQKLKRIGPYCIIAINFFVATVNAYYFRNRFVMNHLLNLLYISNLSRVDVFKKDYCFNQLELVSVENNIDGMVF